jgi:hypothetical protein
MGAEREMTVLVGIDVGTTGVKALAVSPDGEVVARAERSYPLSTPRPLWSEQDPHDWWEASEAALAEVCAGREVAGIGLSGQMHGLVCLDARDEVIRPAILWNDQRTAAECEEIEARIGLERLIELTGNRALTGFNAPKLLWLRRHEPEPYARIAGIALPKDVVDLARKWMIECQHPAASNDVASGDGAVARGWCYNREDVCAKKHGAYGGMTAGAVGALVIYHHILGTEAKRDPAVRSCHAASRAGCAAASARAASISAANSAATAG